jgi:hypothetical protein
MERAAGLIVEDVGGREPSERGVEAGTRSASLIDSHDDSRRAAITEGDEFVS